ncbi:YHS domain-containing protein [Candidatus Daviesbacteria bacterium RIFCSPHIGHO2_01_FULL_40_24]|nr:MAG: YHS domain-containing protein [Candidatus Daviesbacteria bacterium RIFCSPHIGHO2_01_FULL_40_24]OGE30236.1 MAG: YHS domain-containing protein [Candidatus Daviesbacteria bacterium RIFCSPHIGHO2_02_FULL_40_16]OGE43649.1 MAG: YHS domain-containing protein [Candidatus Daviesbacteria bacterium RIFCSPLOWO2_01_FULL_39_23]OGE67913.1 MAG: YHS domain-containing protein [Candidatus Daviesbacteria bacterium RIFCSPLOWO2_02_FULL_39_13]HCE30959.1 YHS domain-containing protein [Candidatus Daviesbacteria b
MKVNLEKTKYKSTYEGKEYGFCSENCKAEFDKNPYQYAEANC